MARRIALFYTFLSLILISHSASAQVPIRLSTGVSLGGTGLAGIPIQLKFGDIAAIDVGGYFRTAHIEEYEDRWFFGPAFDVGVNLFLLKKENQDKNRITRHGAFAKHGHGLHKKDENGLHRLQERSLGIGWVMEVDNNIYPKRFVQLMIGPTIIEHSEAFLNPRYPPDNQIQSSGRYLPMIYFRLTWFFDLDKT